MGYKARVIDGSLNLRKSMSTSSTKLASIPSGTNIDVKDINDGTWIKAYYNYQLGYVMRQYLSEYSWQNSIAVEANERYGAALLQEGVDNDVRVLQQDLRNAGVHDFHDNDGDFGPRTKAAVIAYQQMAGLTADGIVGISTKLSLYGSVVLG